jgi:hypothetical protein
MNHEVKNLYFLFFSISQATNDNMYTPPLVACNSEIQLYTHFVMWLAMNVLPYDDPPIQ